MGELGTRYKCFKCESKFYDLNRPNPICPSCGEDQNNKEAKQQYSHKKKRWPSRVDTDMHVLPEDEDHDGVAEHEEADPLVEHGEDGAKDEYLLDDEASETQEDEIEDAVE